MDMMNDIIEWQDLGLVPYREAWALQDRLRESRVKGAIADRLLMLEHPPVITLGRRECAGDIISPIEAVRSEGIEVVKTNRGGRATYHGPGQLVGYFICSLEAAGMGIRDFVRAVEDVCLKTLRDFDIGAQRDVEHPGLWVGRNKIVAVGMNVSHGVTQHGLAMNVSCRMEHYRHIVACGINDRGVTSMEREVGRAVGIEKVSESFVMHAGAVLGRQMVRLT